MHCRNSCVYTIRMHTKNGEWIPNVRSREVPYSNVGYPMHAKGGHYTQPKRLFIHSVHRVIHRANVEEWRISAVFHGVIHNIHSFSTAVIHCGLHCGYACGQCCRALYPCLHMCHKCINMQSGVCLLACSCGFGLDLCRILQTGKRRKFAKIPDPQRIFRERAAKCQADAESVCIADTP